MEPDNWKHRSVSMRCGTCMFFVAKVPQVSTTVPAGDSTPGRLGRCRRHAPMLAGWPATFANDWCGDHKLDEEKL